MSKRAKELLDKFYMTSKGQKFLAQQETRKTIGAKPMNHDDGKDFMQLVEDYQLKWKVDKVEAMKAIIKKHPDAHRKFIQAANPDKKID